MSGTIERWVTAARADLAERHRAAFVAAGAADVAVLRGPPDDTPFGARLRQVIAADRPAGLVVLGSGAVPLAEAHDYAALVGAAATDAPVALANNRFSADVVAIGCVPSLPAIPDLPGDNALPRWLEEVAGYRVRDLRARWQLAVDIDGPLELVLLRHPGGPEGIDLTAIKDRLAAVRSVAANRRAELVIAGRVSVRTLAWLERQVPARVRAIVEERGLRAASSMAQDREEAPAPGVPAAVSGRPPASLLGLYLETAGPDALGDVVARLGEAALIDSRVLLAHRLGADERAWPRPEDRFASDLLLPERVADPWLRALTTAARDAPTPIALGGHSLVGPGVRLLLGRAGSRRPPWI